MKYFGIGLPKTGTTTLGDYYESCGIKRFYGADIALTHQVMRGNYYRLNQRLTQFDGFEDNPWCILYELLLARYPDAKSILTYRSSPERWLDSCIRHYQIYGPQFSFRQIFGCGIPLGHEHQYINCYSSHLEKVESFFFNYPSQFLTICFEDDCEHDRITSFLGHDPNSIKRVWSNSSIAKSANVDILTTVKRRSAYLGRCAFAMLGLPVL